MASNSDLKAFINSTTTENSSGNELYCKYGIEGLKSILDTIDKSQPYKENNILFTTADDYIDFLVASYSFAEDDRNEILALKNKYHDNNSK